VLFRSCEFISLKFPFLAIYHAGLAEYDKCGSVRYPYAPPEGPQF
jgi:hypothetical protein